MISLLELSWIIICLQEDKAIGWSAHTFPGTQGVIQKDPAKRGRIIMMAKVRLALRYAWAASLQIELLPPIAVSRETESRWADAWGNKYTGDTGWSEKRTKRELPRHHLR